ncbi:uncharacterized protein LOC126978136 [Leptidea sinapis]|uniref:uncharacterized protein LOC126978136 n=1 Tax=Leptidea sinapis TaxID=189913 RepID=UPI0021C27BA3|nr:uncharacterized protein LOC126978136 [Leptidea sinapis]
MIPWLTTETLTIIFMDNPTPGKYEVQSYGKPSILNIKYSLVANASIDKPQVSRSNETGCVLNVQYDFNENQPLFITRKRYFPKFRISNGLVRIRETEKIRLHCGNSNIIYKGNHLKSVDGAKVTSVDLLCLRNKTFYVKESEKYTINYYNIIHFQCDKPFKTILMKNKQKCSNLKTKLFSIGFALSTLYMGLYDVCFNLETKSPSFTRYTIQTGMADYIPSYRYSIRDKHAVDYELAFDCEKQKEHLTPHTYLKTWGGTCCFVRRHLVSPRDVFPGLPQLATYENFNVVAHWNFCKETNNWDEIEQKIRLLLKTIDKLSVWTGTFGGIKNFTLNSHNINVDLSVHVPKYLWKVIHNKAVKSSLAIIQINIPFLTIDEAKRHVRCKDICDQIKWLRGTDWRDVNRGYTYCCRVLDFEKAFSYENRFRDVHKIFRYMQEQV